MAENKKSFVLYCDLIHTIEKLPDDKAGLLFKHLLRYVNDQNPITEDLIVEIAFEPIKHQLKRDLIKYEGKKEQWSDAGKKSAEKRALNKINESQRNSTNVKSVSTVSTVTVNDNVNDNVNVNVNVNDNVNVTVKKEININDIKLYFFENGYSEISAQKFYDYYSVASWKDSKGNKVKNWKQKAQAVWFKTENKIQSNEPKFVM
jgi:hypothetical protein